jgi:hypothetical protein
LAAAKPWKAKLVLGVVWLFRNVICSVGEGEGEFIMVVLLLPLVGVDD